MEKFPIGFWNYTKTGQLHAKDVDDWAELGMTMANSPEFDPNCKKEDMLEILDACEKHDIKVILCDSRSRWNNAADEPEEYEKVFRQVYDDFGRHPAVMGFHVGDEPWSDKAFENCIAAHKIQLKVAPELTPHINFLPYWDGQEKDILKAPTFTDWAKRMAEQSDLRILCYDCYSQMNPGEDGVHNYYKNLRMYMDAADTTGIEPWTTLLSVGHFRYRVPNEDDLRWQLNTAVASGMKGILWFFVYERNPVSNYRLAPIDEFGNKTETFYRMSRVNRHFLTHFGDFFKDATHIATYHVGKAYGGYELFKPHETSEDILDVTCDHGLPAVVGFFEKDGGKYIAVVNNSTTESGLFQIHMAHGARELERFTWEHKLTRVKYDHWDASYYENENEDVSGDWLAPGQMKLYRYK